MRKKVFLPVLFAAGLAASFVLSGNAASLQPAQGKPGKVTICHKPEKNGGKTIRISRSALRAHMRHGDTTGACPAATTTTTTTMPTTTTTTTTTTAELTATHKTRTAFIRTTVKTKTMM